LLDFEIILLLVLPYVIIFYINMACFKIMID